jgi:hypothetical protein
MIKRMHISHKLAAILGLGLGLLLISQVQAYKPVYIHTDADEDYLAQRSPDKPETYYFFKGLFFGGYIRDDSLTDVSFLELAQGLAPHLTKQNYWPAESKESCDLLLMVNWGTTNPGHHGDVARRIIPDPFDGDYYDDLATGEFKESDYEWFGKRRNSKLLGFYPYLRWEHFTGITPQDEYELRAALRTERYFVIVTAFDFQELLENKQWKRVWSTRFNIRSPGTNFVKAHLALSKAAGPYFGKKMKHLGKERANFDPVIAEVEMGDIEVIETLEAAKGEGMLNSLRMREQR